MLIAFDVRAHRADHGVVAEDEPVDVDHQQLQFIETPVERSVQFGFRSFDRRPAHRRARHARCFRHLRNHGLVVARGNAMQQGVQHSRPHLFLVPHGGVSGNLHFMAL
jgi:hypothetical protein